MIIGWTQISTKPAPPGHKHTAIESTLPDSVHTGTMEEEDEGKLTNSGLLYEGNYEEWKDRLHDMLELLGTDLDDLDDPLAKLGNGTSVTTFIKLQVSPRLLLTMPDVGDAHSDHQPSTSSDFLERLELVATPFRLMELPIDVRTRIFSIAISAKGPIQYCIHGSSPFPNGRIHPLTRTSRQLRTETFLLAWSEVTAVLHVSHRSEPLTQQLCIKLASRFHRLDAFERSNKVSRQRSATASFRVYFYHRKSLQNSGQLVLNFSHSKYDHLEITRTFRSCGLPMQDLTRASEERLL